MSSGPPQRRSIVISRTTFLDISGADYDGEIFTFSVKKDDFSWFIKKHYSELDFFRKTILEQSSKFSEKFPSPEEFSDHKEMLLEMTAWIKDCGEVLHSSAMLNQMFFAFLKVNDNALKFTDTDTGDCSFRRHVLTGPVKSGYMYVSEVFAEGYSHRTPENYRKRYFALQDDLLMFENEHAFLAKEQPLGKLELDGYFVAKENNSQDTQTKSSQTSLISIRSYNPCSPCWWLRANTNDEAESWYQTLNGFPTML